VHRNLKSAFGKILLKFEREIYNIITHCNYNNNLRNAKVPILLEANRHYKKYTEKGFTIKSNVSPQLTQNKRSPAAIILGE